jgi:hypothetical protein
MILIMYLVLTCEIIFPAMRERREFSIRKVIEVSGKSSWKNLTDTAMIKLPSKSYFEGKRLSLKEYIRRDDPVTIKLGYNSRLNTVFDGYVVTVAPQIPVVITCEDSMYLLKKTPVNTSYRSVSLHKLLAEICPKDIKFDAVDIDLGAFKAVNTNVAKVLEKLKEQYGLVAYFKDKVLKVGKVYFQNADKKPVAILNFKKNIRSNTLEYRFKEDIKLKVKAISNLKSGKKIEVTVGDDDGEERTLNFYNIESEATLKQLAEQDISKMKVEGYKGKVKCYGEPYIQHTDVISLKDPDYPEKDNNNFTDEVDWVFNESGYSREYEIGQQV